ncbi:hypothetical protein [uncultured Campylobacter sp.]|uniref:hypothetical protein n=1 Tax=uncultured Campylobacter sp. TaxID=218934 RepID=UPI00261AB469|nr:hypothetical protein [uncultured Campylobacter sp.]
MKRSELVLRPTNASDRLQNPYTNPSVANDYISKSDELERTVRDYNKICAK